MRISKQTSDAVEILIHCVRLDDQLLKVGDIAAELGLSKQMALKLSYILSQSGFLETVRGPRGGIRLTPLARDARLGEIVRALELQPLSGVGTTTLFEGYIDEAFEAFLSVLDQHTLTDLARRPRRSARKPSKKRASKAKRAKPTNITGDSAHRRAPSSGRGARL